MRLGKMAIVNCLSARLVSTTQDWYTNSQTHFTCYYTTCSMLLVRLVYYQNNCEEAHLISSGYFDIDRRSRRSGFLAFRARAPSSSTRQSGCLRVASDSSSNIVRTRINHSSPYHLPYLPCNSRIYNSRINHITTMASAIMARGEPGYSFSQPAPTTASEPRQHAGFYPWVSLLLITQSLTDIIL